MASTNITVASAATQIVPLNMARQALWLVNDSDASIFLSLGGQAALNAGIRLNPAGGSLELAGLTRYKGSITAICSAGNKVLAVEEL